MKVFDTPSFNPHTVCQPKRASLACSLEALNQHPTSSSSNQFSESMPLAAERPSPGCDTSSSSSTSPRSFLMYFSFAGKAI